MAALLGTLLPALPGSPAAAAPSVPSQLESIDPVRVLDTRSSAKDQRRASADERARVKPLREAMRKAEQTVEKLGKLLAQIEHAMADPELYEVEQKPRLTILLAEQARLRGELEAAESAWFDASQALDEA